MGCPRVLSLVLAAVVALLPLVPPEHVHEIPGAHGRHEAVTHRHPAPHATHHVRHHDPHHDFDGAAVGDDGDDRAGRHAAAAGTDRPVRPGHAAHDAHDDGADPGGPAGTALDDEDSVVATHEPVFTEPAAAHPPAPAVTAVAWLPAPAVPVRRAPAPFVERLIHGPPRAPAAARPPPPSRL